MGWGGLCFIGSQALYHHPDSSVRREANKWLEKFQQTPEAWQVRGFRSRLFDAVRGAAFRHVALWGHSLCLLAGALGYFLE